MKDCIFGEAEVSGIFARPNGSGYPGGSRDFWNIDLICEARDCIANSGRGTCACPTLATIGKNGKCKGFQTSKGKKG